MPWTCVRCGRPDLFSPDDYTEHGAPLCATCSDTRVEDLPYSVTD